MIDDIGQVMKKHAEDCRSLIDAGRMEPDIYQAILGKLVMICLEYGTTFPLELLMATKSNIIAVQGAVVRGKCLCESCTGAANEHR